LKFKGGLSGNIVTKIREKLVQKNVTTNVSNKLNLDAIRRNSKTQSKVHQNTYNKHQNKNAIVECNMKVLAKNTTSKMQHQFFVAKHKIHVRQILKIASPKCKSAQCYKGMIISFMHNDDHTLR